MKLFMKFVTYKLYGITQPRIFLIFYLGEQSGTTKLHDIIDTPTGP